MGSYVAFPRTRWVWLFSALGIGALPQASVSVSYSAPSSVVLHQPVVVDFAVENSLDSAVQLDMGHKGLERFRFELTRPDGRRLVARPPQRGETEGVSGPSLKVSVDPHGSYTQSVLVNEWVDFSDVGEYSLLIHFDGSSGTSPSIERTFHVTVRPRDEQVLRSLCGQLHDAAIASRMAPVAQERMVKTLSYLADPVAIPFLNDLIEKNILAWLAIPGLARIGNTDAVEALQALTRSANVTTAALATDALTRLRGRGR